MIRLMCAKDRQSLKELESALSKAGIHFEIRGNPLTAALGITRFEVHVGQADLQAAADIWQALAPVGGEADTPRDGRGTRGFNGFVNPDPSGPVIEAHVVPAFAAELPGRTAPACGPETDGDRPKGDLAQVTALLEEEVQALLAREMELVNRCAALEDKVKALDAALAHTRADLAREASNRSEAERKLAEAGETRVSLEKGMQALELRLKVSEQALASAQGEMELQAQQREQLMSERKEEHLQAQAYVGTVNDLRSQIRARLAAREKKDVSVPDKRKRRPVAEGERTPISQTKS